MKWTDGCGCESSTTCRTSAPTLVEAAERACTAPTTLRDIQGLRTPSAPAAVEVSGTAGRERQSVFKTVGEPVSARSAHGSAAVSGAVPLVSDVECVALEAR